MLDNYRSVQFEIPQWTTSYPGCVNIALVHRNSKYSPSFSPQLNLFKFHDVEKIEMNATGGVCRAWDGPRDNPKSQSFIIKFAIAGSEKYHESLGREATIHFGHLSPLQGVDVPKFFGLFDGETLDGTEPSKVTCIVLEDCGDDVEGFFTSLPLVDRAAILKKIGHIHKCGVSLDDFAERNVVQKDGQYRIIDFQHIETGHKCRWKGDLVYEGELIPMIDDIGCSEMLDIGMELGLWKQHYSVTIYGKNVPKSEFPTQEAIDVLMSGLHSFNFENEKRLHNWIKHYKKYEKTMTAQQYMEQFPRPAVERRPRDLEKDEYA